ncbi:hypothetical protein UA08_02085 [Talaromyces atroroseus]|uniref:Uncharacterized protein n=1 Tax=Talaromyces atroroseus TaxID=1441469 RepID=A0A1Q5QAG5_TALAT|nr:hypothetical protein UA08_02085 [Talaromyces atroroseus]OKL62937.1 hypothetical protein UA08_02085 [Talaromyces atroroseus]
MPNRRVPWKKEDKEILFARRKEYAHLTVAEFTQPFQKFYPERTAKAIGQTLWLASKRKGRLSQSGKAGMSLDAVTATTTTPPSTNDDDDDDDEEDEVDSSPEEQNEDISFMGERTPNKRIKRTYSTRSQASLDKPQDPPIVRSQSSEYSQRLDNSSLMLSLRAGGRHSTEYTSPYQIPQTNTFDTNPSFSAPPPAPTLFEEFIAQGQTQNLHQEVQHEKESEQPQPQNQAAQGTVKEENARSPSEIRRQFAQVNAALYPILEMALSRSEASDTEKVRIESELLALQKQYESMQTDKDGQISQLQGEIDRYRNERENWLNGQKEQERLVNENADLRSRLRKLASDATQGL